MDRENRRVLIVEDHPMVAHVIALQLLKHDPALDITIRACTASALGALANPASWFRIFLDLSIPGCHGLFLVRRCKEMGVIKRCAVISASENAEWMAEIQKIGALGYIWKGCAIQKFSDALRSVLTGELVFHNDVTGFRSYLTIHYSLTRRQRDVLCLLHRGYTSKKIASQLGLQPGTVDNHVMGLVRALRASGRAHAIVKGIELGYLE